MWATVVNNFNCVFKKLFSYSDAHFLAEALMALKNIKRGLIARKYIKGSGLEIGGLHSSLAKVTYVDRQSTSELRKIYPYFHKLVDVGIVDDGEQLATIQDTTQDFVIGNHFLEHCQNPLFAIENMLRVLKSQGILYLIA